MCALIRNKFAFQPTLCSTLCLFRLNSDIFFSIEVLNFLAGFYASPLLDPYRDVFSLHEILTTPSDFAALQEFAIRQTWQIPRTWLICDKRYTFTQSKSSVSRTFLSNIRAVWSSHCLFFGWSLLTQRWFFTSGASSTFVLSWKHDVFETWPGLSIEIIYVLQGLRLLCRLVLLYFTSAYANSFVELR